MHRRLETGPQV